MDVTATRAGGDVCGRCAEPVETDHRFCEACGYDLHRVRADGGTLAPTPGPAPCPACGAARGVEPGGYCDDCGMRRPEPRVVSDLGRLAGVSDRGRVHPSNEDAIAVGGLRDGLLAAVVCDGVSSTVRPERAARAAADTALDVLLRAGPSGGTGRIRAAVTDAARAVDALGGGPTGPSCTLVAGLVEPGPDGTATITVGWVGDSRAYWLDGSDAGGRVLTTDHSWAAEMVAAGLRDTASAERDPRAHAITRWLGPSEDPDEPDGPRSTPDVVALRADRPGTLLLCTDGLWNYLSDPGGLAAVVRDAASPLAAADALVGIALEAGGRDNVSVVVLPVDPARAERGTTT